jgi:serine protease
MKNITIALLSFLTVLPAVAGVFKEPFKNGMVITEWDLAFPSEAAYADYQSSLRDSLIVDLKSPGVFNLWGKPDQKKLTYCVSDNFKEHKKDVIEALLVATQDWMTVANVKFTHVATEDSNCNASNSKVMFDVNPVNMGQYLARSFFPSYPRSTRNLMVDASSFKYSFVALSGFIRHELGHILGFRHEHISKQSPGLCPEDNRFSPLTDYDPNSVMHYPQCGGKNNIQNMILSELDKVGVAKAYPF